MARGARQFDPSRVELDRWTMSIKAQEQYIEMICDPEAYGTGVEQLSSVVKEHTPEVEQVIKAV